MNKQIQQQSHKWWFYSVPPFFNKYSSDAIIGWWPAFF